MLARLLFAVCLLHLSTVWAEDVRIKKVLPQLLDAQGRNALTPSLFDRDAYQQHLKHNPSLISALRFDVNYKAKNLEGPLLLRLEVRGSNTALGKQFTFEAPVEPTGWLPKWGRIQLSRETSEAIGSIVAWRASLVKDGIIIAEQESFLW